MDKIPERYINAFQELGLTPEANESEVSKAYKRAALKHHPDRNSGSDESTQKFQQIGAAYEICLSYYSRKDAFQGAPSFTAFDPEDDVPLDPQEEAAFFQFLFEEVFHGRYTRAKTRQYRRARAGGAGAGVYAFSGGFADAQERQRQHRERQNREHAEYLKRVKEFERECEAEERAARRKVKEEEAAANRLAAAYVTAFQVARTGDLSKMRQIFSQYDLNVNNPQSRKKLAESKYESMLHAAAQSPKADAAMIEFLLEKGADVNAINAQNLTPFLGACRSGNVAAAKVLLTHKEVHPSRVGKTGETPLQLAMKSNSLEMIELLVKDATVHDVRKCWEMTNASREIKKVLETKRGFTNPESCKAEPTTKKLSKRAQRKLAEARAQEEKQARLREEEKRAEVNRQKKLEAEKKRIREAEEMERGRVEEAANRLKEEQERARVVEERRRRAEAAAKEQKRLREEQERARLIEEERSRAEAAAKEQKRLREDQERARLIEEERRREEEERLAVVIERERRLDEQRQQRRRMEEQRAREQRAAQERQRAEEDSRIKKIQEMQRKHAERVYLEQEQRLATQPERGQRRQDQGWGLPSPDIQAGSTIDSTSVDEQPRKPGSQRPRPRRAPRTFQDEMPANLTEEQKIRSEIELARRAEQSARDRIRAAKLKLSRLRDDARPGHSCSVYDQGWGSPLEDVQTGPMIDDIFDEPQRKPFVRSSNAVGHDSGIVIPGSNEAAGSQPVLTFRGYRGRGRGRGRRRGRGRGRGSFCGAE